MKSHVYKDDGSFLCGETSITAHAGDTCAKCQKGVDKLHTLLFEAAQAIQTELNAVGADEVAHHPVLVRKKKLVDKIFKHLGYDKKPEGE